MIPGWVHWGQGGVLLGAEGCTVAAAEIYPFLSPARHVVTEKSSQDGPPRPGHGAERWQG